MAETVLKLSNLTKSYIMGNKKNAHKAQKEIQKLHHTYEHAIDSDDQAAIKKTEAKLTKAEDLFSKERYDESYYSLTRKRLKKRKRDKGTVVHALNRVNLEIKRGDLVAIMGPSGSGKSTLLNMLGILDQPTAGRVFVKGQNVAGLKSRDLPELRSKELGFVFQSFNLIPTLTAQENVMLPLKYAGLNLGRRKQLAKAALERVGLGDRLHHSPNELSGGQRQRVAIARSIVNNPAIVFGDELTGELDSKMTADIMRLIKELNKKGQTFIIVTHNPDVAKVCRRVIMMKDGRVEKEIINK